MATKKALMLMVIFITIIVSSLTAAEKYAVLITGDYADWRGDFEGSWAIANELDKDRSPMEEFWHDTFLMWEMLLNKGYSDENIFVLFAGGDDFQDPYILEGERYVVPWDLAPMTDYQADLANVELVLEGLAYGNQQEDIPQLQEDDFLTIWTFDHGDWHDGHRWLCLIGSDEISDEEFGNLVNQIDCHKKVIFMQQCFSGGFVPYLENENSVIFTAANDHMPAFRDDALYFDGIDYPGDPEPGNSYWAYERDIWAGHEYRHGEYNFHLMNSLKGETPAYDTSYQTDYGNFPLEDADENQDGLCSIFESSEWVKEFDSRQRPYYGTWGPYDDPQWSDAGEIGETTTLEYPTLLIEDITSSMEITGLTAISGITIHIENGATLTIPENAELCLVNGAELIVNDGSVHIAGGELLLDDNSNVIVHDNVTLSNHSLVEVTNGSEFQLKAGSSLYGTECTRWVDTYTGERYDTWEEMHEEVPNHNGNIVMVPGDKIIVNGGSFDAYADDDPSNRVTISAVGDNRWDGIELNDSPSVNWFNYCDISKMSYIKINNANFHFMNSTFSNGNQIIARNNSYLCLNYSILDSFNACPIVSYESMNVIGYCTITNSETGNGISIYYPSDSLNVISSNNIEHNDYWGISYYDTPVYSMNNDIVENGSHGLVVLGSSGTPVLAGNLISNNVGAELISNRWCFPDLTSYVGTHFGPNTIEDDINSGGADHYLLMCGGYDGNPIDCRGNNIDTSDTTRFFPFYSAYIFDGEKPPEKILYEEGVVQITDGEYESAKVKMKEIVDIYPATATAENALQWLMYLEKFSGHDYADLRNYIENIDEVSYPHLERVKYNTTTSTYMAEADYLTAINRLETILANPPSEPDSVFAYIDQGYCYLKLDEQGGKSAVEKCTFKPRGFEEFRYVSQNMTRDLLDKAIPHPETSTGEVETFALYQNYPNPMRTLTTISFSTAENTKNAEIKIYNIKGQLVKQFSISNEKSSIEWNGKDENGKQLGSGIYFYKLDTGEKSITKKIVLLR